jgi:hypothetical protein
LDAQKEFFLHENTGLLADKLQWALDNKGEDITRAVWAMMFDQYAMSTGNYLPRERGVNISMDSGATTMEKAHVNSYLMAYMKEMSKEFGAGDHIGRNLGLDIHLHTNKHTVDAHRRLFGEEVSDVVGLRSEPASLGTADRTVRIPLGFNLTSVNVSNGSNLQVTVGEDEKGAFVSVANTKFYPQVESAGLELAKKYSEGHGIGQLTFTSDRVTGASQIALTFQDVPVEVNSALVITSRGDGYLENEWIAADELFALPEDASDSHFDTEESQVDSNVLRNAKKIYVDNFHALTQVYRIADSKFDSDLQRGIKRDADRLAAYKAKEEEKERKRLEREAREVLEQMEKEQKEKEKSDKEEAAEILEMTDPKGQEEEC